MHRAFTEKQYEVAVIGGGPSGIAAAIAAARRGKKVVLVEKNAFLGGVMTSGLGILGHLDRAGHKALGGFAEEWINRLLAVNGAIGNYRCPVHNSISPILPAWVKIVAVEMCREAGVNLMLDQELLDVIVENGSVTGAIIYGKCMRTVLSAQVFIDATGDGDMGFIAGAPYRSGQNETGVMQPATPMFSVTDYDLDAFLSYAEAHPEDFGIKEDYAEGYTPEFFRKTPGHCFIGMTEMIRKAQAAGDFDVPRNQFIYITTPNSHNIAINTTRILNIDASDPEQLSAGLEEGYIQIHILMRFMNKYLPGFKHARLSEISPTLGIRETRHFESIFPLTAENMYSSEVKKQAIAQSAHNIDIHSGTQDHIDLCPVDTTLGIPYGALVPRMLDGLLFCGRNIDLDTTTYASARVIGPCMAIGEAAGEAAAMSIEKGLLLRDLPVDELQVRLKENGNLF